MSPTRREREMRYLFDQLTPPQCAQINARIVTAAAARRWWDLQAQPAPVLVLGAPEKPFPLLRRMLILNLVAAALVYGGSFLSALSGWGFPVAAWNLLLLHGGFTALFFWADPLINSALRQALQSALGGLSAG